MRRMQDYRFNELTADANTPGMKSQAVTPSAGESIDSRIEEAKLPSFAQVRADNGSSVLRIEVDADELATYSDEVSQENSKPFRQMLDYFAATCPNPNKPGFESIELAVSGYDGQNISAKMKEGTEVPEKTGDDWATACWRGLWDGMKDIYVEERAPPKDQKVNRFAYLNTNDFLAVVYSGSLIAGGAIGDIIYLSVENINPDVIGASVLISLASITIPAMVYTSKLKSKSPTSRQEVYCGVFRDAPVSIKID